MNRLEYRRAIAIDCETDGFHIHDGHRPFLVILYPDVGRPVLCWVDDDRVSYVPDKDAKELTYLEGWSARETVRTVLEDPQCLKSYWNAPFDWRHCKAQWGLVPVWPWADEQVRMALLDETAFPFRLKQCAAGYLREDTSSASAIAEWLARNTEAFVREHGRAPTYKDVPKLEMARYCADDGKYTIKFEYLLAGGIRRLGMEGPFYDEMQLTPCLVDMLEEGVEVDSEYLAREREKALGMVLYQERRIAELTGSPCPNIGSSKQVAELMYGRLGITCQDFTDGGGQSTGKIALKRWARDNDVVARIKRIRQLLGVAKMNLTIIEAIRGDGKLHPSQNATGARTGRMSMNDPNLQNATREGTVKGFSIRSAFRPPAGYRMFHLDYKQIEMVDFADYSQDPVMCQAIRDGRDIHQETARRILVMLGHPEREPTGEERQQAKTCNFAVIYGSGDKTFSETLNNDDSIDRLFTVGEARQLRLAYMAAFPGVQMLKEKVAFQIHTHGKVTDRFGRSHRLGSEEWYKGINWLVQGGCAHLLKRAIVRMHACARWWNENDDRVYPTVKVVMTVHDEIGFKVKAGIDEDTTRLIVSTMAAAMTADRNLYTIPLRVDAEEQAPDWGHMAKYAIPKEMPWDHPSVESGRGLVSDASGVGAWWKSVPSAP